MKKFLLPALLLVGFGATAQTTLFQEDFETYENFTISNFGNWMLNDGDGGSTYIGGVTTQQGVPPWPNAYAAMAYQIFNPSVAGVQNGHDGEGTNFNPHGGQKYAASWASDPQTAPNGNNDWLVSPAITLGTSGNKLSFWIKSLAADYGLENYKVLIYTGTGAPTSTSQFVSISGTTPKNAPDTWTKAEYNLDQYKNQTIRFAINNVGKDHYMLMVDDVLVTTDALGTSDNKLSKSVSVFPNPSIGIFNIKSTKKVKDISVISIDGKAVSSTKSADKIDISNLSKGVYVLKVNFEDGTSTTEKIIKK